MEKDEKRIIYSFAPTQIKYATMIHDSSGHVAGFGLNSNLFL